MIKLSVFADDMTCVLKDKSSYTNLFRILNSFGECSGLKVNDEKTEIMPLGDNILQEKDFPTQSTYYLRSHKNLGDIFWL